MVHLLTIGLNFIVMNFLAAHHLMLRDEVRLRQYARAIRKVVNENDRVLDLGAGTGILGFLALRVGARQVYAVEKGRVINAARLLAGAQGFEGRYRCFRSRSQKVKLPHKADVLVTETIGHFGVEEGILDSVADANRRLLKPGARIVPGKLTLSARAITLPAKVRDWMSWKKPVQGISYRALSELAMHGTWLLPQWPKRFLSPAAEICSFGLEGLRKNPLPIDTSSRLRIDRAGPFHGVIGWFKAQLASSILLNSPDTSHWRPVFFPVNGPIPVRPGDRVHFELRIERDAQYSWRVTVKRGRRQILMSNHSTLLLHGG